MIKIFFTILLFFIAASMAFSKDCTLNSCNQESKNIDPGLKKPNLKRIFSRNNNSSILENLEEQIIASVNNQVSKINTDLSLAYRKKTISIRYDMKNNIPHVNSYISISYRKSTISLNYTIANW